jgi:integral membrane sensor domain MASE1
MVAIPVPPALAPAAIAVGMHGLSDALTHRAAVPAYMLAVPTWPHTTALFTLASVFHFAEDVGIRNSLVLHACIVGTAAVSVSISVALTLLYMCTVHVPRHFRKVERLAGRERVSMLVAASLVAPVVVARAGSTLLVTDPVQRVVCVHIAIHLVRPLSR